MVLQAGRSPHPEGATPLSRRALLGLVPGLAGTLLAVPTRAAGQSPPRRHLMVAREVERQVDLFTRLTGTFPAHIDSHHHVHWRYNVARVFHDVSARHGRPLRGLSRATYIGAFHARWDDGKTDLRRISPETLASLVSSVSTGLSEIACHPGYLAPGPVEGYGPEREIELRALTDPRVRAAIEQSGVILVSYHDYPRLTAPVT